MKIQIKKDDVVQFDIEHLKKLSISPEHWHPAGISEYRLYSYLSTLFDNTIILDIGTRTGNSALALSHNSSNKIISYDLQEQGASNIKKDNITWKIKNFMEDSEINWDNVSIVMIDVDPHDGIQEREMMKWLEEKKWKGILIHDDIMEFGRWAENCNMWDEIKYEKLILTDIGHSTGTGLVNFGDSHEIIII